MKTPMLALAFAAILAAPVTATASDELSWQGLYEEENLAHDLYARFEAAHGLNVFANIGRSEERHIAAVATLLVAHDIDVPAHTTGIFHTPALQSVFDQLAAQGDASAIGALRAGALVEEIDIADLDTLLTRDDLSSRDRLVLTNLRTASGRHLQAFVRNLAARGELYTPAVLDDATFEAIATTGGRGRRGGNAAGCTGLCRRN